MSSFGKVTYQVSGFDELAALFEKYGDAVQEELAASLQRRANELMNASLALVPVDRGTLRSSGHVQPVVREGTGMYVLLGYGGPASPYAFAVHENPRAGKTEGISPSGKKYKHWAATGEWKYLEEPWLAMRDGFLKQIADDIVEAVGRRVR